MNLLSIQSHVAYGHVGNSAAVFPLQRLGVEVWPIHTVQFSNHPGYGAWKGEAVAPAMIREIFEGIAQRGVLGECAGVLSGYIGSAETGAAILDCVAAVKRANSAARYCCDPVIGDVGRGVYVDKAIPEFFRSRALAMADVVTPNHFELGQLCGLETGTRGETFSALDAVHELGPGVILVTSLQTGEVPDDSIDILVSDKHGRFRVRTPRLPLAVNGAGDALSALFFMYLLRLGSAAEALSRSVSSVFGILKHTAEKGSRELMLVDAQQELVAPGRTFDPEFLGRA